MAFEALKGRLGMGGRHRQYIDIESVRDLEDISDPETVEDESQHGVRDWASTHPVLATIMVVAIGMATVIMLLWARRVVPGILTDPRVWKGAFVLAVFGAGYRYGWRNHDKRVTDWDELELVMDGKLVSFKGVYLDDFPGESDGFIPIKGWRRGGHHAVPYSNGELGASMVENFNPYTMSDDAAVVIRLKPTETEVTTADWGTRVVQRTRGLKPDGDGNHTTLVAELPHYDDDTMEELARQNEQLADDYHSATREVQGLKRRVANLMDRLNDPIDDEVAKRIDEFRAMSEAVQPGRRGRSSDEERLGPQPRQDWAGTGKPDNGQNDELEALDEELSDDD